MEGLAELAPVIEEGQEEDAAEPMHPADLLTMLVAYMVENIGGCRTVGDVPSASYPCDGHHGFMETTLRLNALASSLHHLLSAEPASQPGPLRQALSAVRGVIAGAARQVRSARKLVWQIEDIAKGGASLALRVARKSVRPLLIGLVVNRALRTIEASRLPEVRMARMSPAERLEYANTRLMGADWREQINQDMLNAAREVQEGHITGECYQRKASFDAIERLLMARLKNLGCLSDCLPIPFPTDDYVEEKRKLTAAMLRRLEIEDWDKERMRHFYYGSYGLGPWYFDMEERLHNPYFIGARAWNGPIEGWVGKNKKYNDDIPLSNTNWSSAALDAIEKRRGIQLTPEQRARITRSQAGLSTTDVLLATPLIIGAAGGRDKLKSALAAE